MKNSTILRLALSRLRYQKSRTLLTGIAIMLTTLLLMAIGTVGIATFDMDRQIASESDFHAAFSGLTSDQAAVLSKHIHVEAMSTTEVFATIVNGKINGSLIYREAVKDERLTDKDSVLHQPKTESGHYPESENEICSSPAFFRRIGAEPAIGRKVTLSFRINDRGEIRTNEFVISGLLPDVEISEEVDDSRLVWTAYVSRSLLNQYSKTGLYKSVLNVNLRVYGEEELSYNEMSDRIYGVAADIGLKKENVILNSQYLYTATNPNTEAILILCVIGLIVIFFSALVIYSIYYVGVITDVQEIGKLKAIGTTGAQIARLFHCQGAIVCAFAIPVGLTAGFLLPWFLFPFVIQAYGDTSLNSQARETADALMGQIHMFSWPLLFAVAAAVMITVFLSLMKPIRMAKRVSPVEAIRYRENTTDSKRRRGHTQVKVSTLTFANLTRNKRRTAVTILTMGLSCVLFICVSAVLSSVRAEDLARREIPEGDFRIALDCSYNDKEYPENNLDSLVQQNYFSDAFLAQLSAIDGVKEIHRARGRISSSSENGYALYTGLDEEPIRLAFSYFTREDLPELSKNLIRGTIDYDRMTANREVICTHEYSFDECGLSLGDVIPLTLYDGERKIPLTVTLTSLALPDSDFPLLIVTEDTWKELGLVYDPTTDIYLYVEDSKYDSVKESLAEIVSQNEHLVLYSMDVEMKIGRYGISLTVYPLYLLLSLIAVISFINLINTMITSIVTRKKELGVLQAIGLSDRQLIKMLAGEGLVFTAGTLLISLTLGNLAGYLLYCLARKEHLMSISRYHYPLWETITLTLVLVVGQILITLFIHHQMKKESLIDRIRNQE